MNERRKLGEKGRR